MLTYKKGAGDKGSLVWAPNPNIIAALDKAFKLAFQNITPTGKRIKIALDVSGSMSGAYCTGSPVVSCAIGSVAMMMMTLYVERGVAPPNGASSAQLTAPGATPPPPATPLWKTTQLPDGRTLYENTKTNECQFTKPASLAGGGAAPGAATQAKLAPLGGATPGATPSSAAPRPTLTEYKATRKYLGYPDAQPATDAPRPSFGYSSYYTPPAQYLPELYKAPATPSNVTICAFSSTIIDITNAIVGYMNATIDPTTGLPTMTIDDALKLVEMPFSSTDCALPMIRALETREKVDAFVIYTDSETYMGTIHPQAALEEYRRVMGIDAKLIVVGMTSNCLTIADPKDLNTLNLAGFDTATPRLINDFISGGLLGGSAGGSAPPRRDASGGAAEPAEEGDEFVMLNLDD
jgi:hypothetical protein